jgi:hypothetical protein
MFGVMLMLFVFLALVYFYHFFVLFYMKINYTI